MSTTSFGKSIEMKFESYFLEKGCKVYTPLADDHGVDCIIKNKRNEFIEIQIKSRSKNVKNYGLFTVKNHTNPIPNFYFIFYSELTDTTWIMSSKDFCKYANARKGKSKKITLKRENSKFKKYIDNYDFI